MFFLKILFLKSIRSAKFISKICYILICTCLHISCSRNIGKFGSHKEEEKYAFDNRSQEKIGSSGNEEKDNCPICLEGYTKDYYCIKLKCYSKSNITHDFHQHCIRKWIDTFDGGGRENFVLYAEPLLFQRTYTIYII
ncbi:RING finger domain-containing protein [Cardinium endosymbiont of Tipula unca]|uniref:RING finger domain-containing protein n=1 Tax=Cardinium endosymbiont of Tipula unca TaxID=3066216 RepID=UPI003BAEA772